MKRMLRLLVLAAMTLLLLPASSYAVNLPCYSVKFIIPWGAGGDTDIIMRTVVDAAQKIAGKNIAVVNISGQGGNKGAKEALAAKADGCTLFSGHDSMETSYLSGRVDFNYFAFQPVALLTSTPSILAGNNQVPWNNMKELVAAAKKAPGTILVGATLGSTSQFFPLLIEDAAGIKFKYVNYDGTRQRMTALLSHNIQLGEVNIIAASEYLKQGSIKALGIATPKRDPRLPQVATLKEQGIDVTYGVHRGIFLQKGVSKAIVNWWAGVFKKAVERPDVIKAIQGKGTNINYLGPAAYVEYLKKDAARTERVAKSVGIYKRKG